MSIKPMKPPRTGKSAIYQALAAAFVLAVAATTTHAAPTEYAYSGAFQTWTVGTTGLYDIQAFGAQGGASGNGHAGGLGAAVGSFFSLTEGDVLQILVGGQGGAGAAARGGYSGGGGGVSVVFDFTRSTLLVAAGGGGGADPVHLSGGDGLASFGVIGYGGAGPDYDGGGGGGGFNGAGRTGYAGDGGSFSDPFGGSAGGRAGSGGFGGGGGGNIHGGGGGGGFDGGDGGGWYGSVAMGGNSYAGGSVYLQTSGAHAGDGLVTIELAPTVSAVPEPETLSLFGLGLGALMLRRRQRAGGGGSAG